MTKKSTKKDAAPRKQVASRVPRKSAPVAAAPAPPRADKPHKKLSKKEKVKNARRNTKRLLARVNAAQVNSHHNFLPRSLAAREFKFMINEMYDAKDSRRAHGTMVRREALQALREITQDNTVRLLQQEAMTMKRAGKAQVTSEGLRATARNMGLYGKLDAPSRPAPMARNTEK